MMASRLAAALPVFALLCGCVPSLHPRYTEATTILDPRIEGTWLEDGGHLWTFHPAEKKRYLLEYRSRQDKGEAADLEATLLQLEQYLFLDTFPEARGASTILLSHTIRAHNIARVWLEADSLRLASLDPDWLERAIEKELIDISHQVVNGDIVLTAPTADLQRFALFAASQQGTFADPITLRRGEG